MSTPRSVRVTLNVDIPEGVEATETEIEAWLRFHFHERGGLRGDNPLIDYEPEANNVWVEPA